MAECVRLLCDAQAMIGESPLQIDGGILWTDPVQGALLRFDGALEAIPTETPIWSLARPPRGPIVGASDDRLNQSGDGHAWRPGPRADVAAGCRFNDMAAGPDGALWIGMMHRGTLATRGSLYRAASPEETPQLVATGLGVPNGMKVSRDGGKLFVVDTLMRTLLAYPIDGAGLGEPSIVTDFMGVPGKPDGMAMGDDGSFRVAMWGGGCVAHVGADGAILGWDDVPAPHVSSACFVSPTRLVISTSRMRLSPAALAASPASGGLFAIDLEVRT